MEDKKIQIGMLIFPKMTQLDFTGPFEALARLPNAQVHVVWKTKDPVTSDTGLSFLPTTTLAECPPLDVICVPGGPGQIELMDDQEVIGFVRTMGGKAKYVTSVCTGALVLGAAGLLDGYEAATHWMSAEQLPLFGAKPVARRFVVDRNRITGGGVTAGIDFGLYLASQLGGEEAARRIQLFLEYDPAPPFDSGSPRTAAAPLVQGVRDWGAKMIERRWAASRRAAERLKQTPAL
ncbi:MAG: DJ-1/PfpI family protein [Burkholderiales bacterium]